MHRFCICRYRRPAILHHFILFYFILFYFLYKFIYFIYFWLHWVFVAAHGLFSSCSERGLLFLVVHRLIAVASLVAENGL